MSVCVCQWVRVRGGQYDLSAEWRDLSSRMSVGRRGKMIGEGGTALPCMRKKEHGKVLRGFSALELSVAHEVELISRSCTSLRVAVEVPPDE